jgi:peptidylprolyl isomerase
MTTASGLQIIDSPKGGGGHRRTPKTEPDLRQALYRWLYENGQKGKKFDSSSTATSRSNFKIGVRQVIGAWDEGVAR